MELNSSNYRRAFAHKCILSIPYTTPLKELGRKLIDGNNVEVKHMISLTNISLIADTW